MPGLVLWRLSAAAFFGGGTAALLATREVFRIAPGRREAGTYSGAVLRAVERLRFAAAALAVVGALIGPGPWMAASFLVALVAVNAVVDGRLRALRAELGGTTEGLAPADPRRQRFGALHGVSVLLLLIQTLAGAALLARG